ncbi:MAG: hypothetical protein AVDCRST_MAG44-441 [uncultured Sphingomonas sp.]|uniref:Uncharacterized protein n=1 Tax=uncultured Sphingomonas sp. TaxID=158754 RepID=A0A6J4SGI0_9SPHN|nr:MAG: hypothetical protein AVDCRST_MAG44-441 [uncultured Sphingomonas sp.]
MTVPVMATGILTGLRYALWGGWLRGKVERAGVADDNP